MRTDPEATEQRAGLWTFDAGVLWICVCLLLALAAFLSSRGSVLKVQDFRAFYAAGDIVRHHPSLLFDLNAQGASQQGLISPGLALPFYHPAYEALLYAPLSLLSYRSAYFVYMGWNMLLLWACYLAAPLGRSEFARRFPRSTLFFLSFPLLLCVFAGQNSLLFLLGLCLSYRCFEEHRDWAAGAFLGLVLFKLPIVVPLFFLLTLRRGWHFLQGFLLSAAGVILVSVWLTGFSGSRDFLHLLSAATLATDHSVQAQQQAAAWLPAMPNMAGFLYVCGLRYVSAKTAVAVNAGVSLLIFAGCMYLIRRIRREATAFCVALICALLLSPHLYIYDYTALLLPILLLRHKTMAIVAAIWFVELPVLCWVGILTWFSPAVIIPMLLLGMCVAELFEDRHRAESIRVVEAIV